MIFSYHELSGGYGYMFTWVTLKVFCFLFTSDAYKPKDFLLSLWDEVVKDILSRHDNLNPNYCNSKAW